MSGHRTIAPRADLTRKLINQGKSVDKKQMIQRELPKYKEASLGISKAWNKATKGAATHETAIGPRKVRGTTPGNSKWSY